MGFWSAQDSKNPIIPKSARVKRLNPKTALRIQKSGQARYVGSHTIPCPPRWQEGVDPVKPSWETS